MASTLTGSHMKPKESLLDNWDFEDQDESVNNHAKHGFLRMGANDKRLKSWTIFGHSIDLIGAAWTKAAHGNFCVELTGGMPGGIEQSFPTETDADYTVTFSIAASPQHAGTDIVHVSVADYKGRFVSEKSPFKPGVPAPLPIKWKDVSFTFRANDKESTIRFWAPHAAYVAEVAGYIDNVRITKGRKFRNLPDPNILKNGDFEESINDEKRNKEIWNTFTDHGPITEENNGWKVWKDALAPWRVTKGSVDLVHRRNWGTPQSGDYFVDMNGYNAGTLEQTFETKPGKTYTVRFNISGHAGLQNKTRDIVVTVAGESKKYTSSKGKPNHETEWLPVTFDFVAKNRESTLKFESADETGNLGCYLDNVMVADAAVLADYEEEMNKREKIVE